MILRSVIEFLREHRNPKRVRAASVEHELRLDAHVHDPNDCRPKQQDGTAAFNEPLGSERQLLDSLK
jgi:hypothetical protein